MIGRVAALIYGIASYFVFFCSFPYSVAFIGNYFLPESMDVGSEGGLAPSILIDDLELHPVEEELPKLPVVSPPEMVP